MTNQTTIYRILNYAMGLVWLINGLFCKVLNGVPRHQLIVAKISGEEYAHELTKLIGFSEILMAVWVVSLILPRLCAITQILLISVMNTIEFIQAPDLLLFGKWNAFNALLIISVIFLNEFVLTARKVQLD